MWGTFFTLYTYSMSLGGKAKHFEIQRRNDSLCICQWHCIKYLQRGCDNLLTLSQARYWTSSDSRWKLSTYSLAPCSSVLWMWLSLIPSPRNGVQMHSKAHLAPTKGNEGGWLVALLSPTLPPTMTYTVCVTSYAWVDQVHCQGLYSPAMYIQCTYSLTKNSQGS